jgi:hypothetical protein
MADAVGKFPAAFQAPLSDRLICHRDAASHRHLLDHAQAQRKPEIQPDRIADHLGGVAIASIKWLSVRHHLRQISENADSSKPQALRLDGAQNGLLARQLADPVRRDTMEPAQF